MKAYMGVTDLDWYLQLAKRSLSHDEVNFWFPRSRQGFAALSSGDPFFFKTHVMHGNPAVSDRIVGVGLFSGFARLRTSEAWDWFGLDNGVGSLAELRERIQHYRKEPLGPFDDPEIGAVLLRQVRFFPPSETFPSPGDFARNLVRGRSYALADLPTTHSAIEAFAHYLHEVPDDTSLLIRPETHGEAITTIPRIGQQAFKAVIAENFHHHCAITGDKVRPVLQAAHILPIEHGGEHRRDNGLLLRSDVHTLFDRGYIGVDDRYRLQVSPALRQQFGNGDWFYQHAGMPIEIPDKKSNRPNRDFLAWHSDAVFLH